MNSPICVNLRLSAVAVAVLLAGCANLRWHKDGADAAALERDLGECQQQAHAQAVRQSWSYGLSSPPIIGVDAQGHALLSQPRRTDSDLFFMEHDLERICMRGRGYQLLPVEKPKG
jgi:hypothetical protein